MRANLRAVLLLCLFAIPAFAKEPVKEKQIGCIETLKEIHTGLMGKGSELITQLFNEDVYIAMYVGRIDETLDRYLLIAAAVKTDDTPNNLTRIRCVRETDGAKFNLLRLAYPLDKDKA